jgi:hypothetical protein
MRTANTTMLRESGLNPVLSSREWWLILLGGLLLSVSKLYRQAADVQNTDEQAQGNNFRKNLLEVEYSLEGTIRTDVIFRVSSLDAAMGTSGSHQIAGLQPGEAR